VRFTEIRGVETEEKKVPPELRGSELLILGINPDITTPYYLPRWINQRHP
jgi:hypothetical protein